MGNTITIFSSGLCQSLIDTKLQSFKSAFNIERKAQTIDKFFRPIITSLFDALQVISLHTRASVLLKKGRIFPRVSAGFSWQICSVFLVAKAFFSFGACLTEGLLGKTTRQLFAKIHKNLDMLIPLASVIATVATMNLFFIVGYAIHSVLEYLGNNSSLNRDMKKICVYSAWGLGLTSLLILQIPSKIPLFGL